MNNTRREKLRQATALLTQAGELVSSVLGDEESSLANMPENLQDSERCQKMEDAIDQLYEAVSELEAAKECIAVASE